MPTVNLLCIDGLHRVEADPGDTSITCPDCGCRRFRREVITPDVPVMGDAAEVSFTIKEGRHAVGGDTWLSDRSKFVEILRRDNPGISDAEASKYTTRWFS